MHVVFTRAKVRKATINLVMSVCPSSWKNAAPFKRGFQEIWYLNIFFKNVSRKIQI